MCSQWCRVSPDRAGAQTGDWFCIPQSEIRVAAQYPDDIEHRWIVARQSYAGELTAVLRTTKPSYSEFDHDRHENGHEQGCRIDVDGWLCKPAEVHDEMWFAVERRSCTEPDDAILERVMSWSDLPPRRPTGRRRRQR